MDDRTTRRPSRPPIDKTAYCRALAEYAGKLACQSRDNVGRAEAILATVDQLQELGGPIRRIVTSSRYR